MNKQIKYTLEWIVNAEDSGYLTELLEKGRENGNFEIIDIDLVKPTKNTASPPGITFHNRD